MLQGSELLARQYAADRQREIAEAIDASRLERQLRESRRSTKPSGGTPFRTSAALLAAVVSFGAARLAHTLDPRVAIDLGEFRKHAT